LVPPLSGEVRDRRAIEVEDAPAHRLVVRGCDLGGERLQAPGVGEQLMRTMRVATPSDPASTKARLVAAAVPEPLAAEIAAAHDETMSRCILDFYRSAIPNLAAEWWNQAGPTASRGLVLLLPDPPHDEEMSIDVARRLGAPTTRLDHLNHCWMAEDPNLVGAALNAFWASLDS